MSTSSHVTVGEVVRAQIVRRRPTGLTVGATHRCAEHRAPGSWWLAGRPWCEPCWWSTPPGRQLLAELNKLISAARAVDAA